MLQPPESIALLIPDLPGAEMLLPWLQRMDATRRYTNFGPLVQELEATLAQEWPVTSADTAPPPIQVRTFHTGTAPLELAIAAMGLERGAEVLVPAYTFPATASAALRNGLQVVFADIAPDTWQLTPQTARAVVARRPVALVMPVATFGAPVDVDPWDAFVAETGIPVLIDAAAAFGNQAIGTRTHVSFSMHATKPFGIGEGGLLVSRDIEFLEKVRHLSDFGFSQGRSVALGTNAKLSEYAAAVGLAQWSRHETVQKQRRNLWSRFRDQLVAVPGLALQRGFASGTVPANVVVRLPIPAEKASTALALAGIQTRRWYYPSLPEHPAFSNCAIHLPPDGAPLAETRTLAQHAIGLPWHNFLRERDFAHIRDTLLDTVNGRQAD